VTQPKLPRKVEPLTWAGPDDLVYAETGLIHCAYIPPGATAANPAAVVVMLHGWAGDETSMWLFKQAIPPNVAIITPRAPFALEGGGNVWFPYQPEARAQPHPDLLESALTSLQQFLARLPRHYPVDSTRLVLLGFSQGAMVGNAFIFLHPESALGVVSLAGAVPPVFYEEAQFNLPAGISVFIAHGSRDQVIPIEAARQARQLFSAAGADVTYGEYPAAHKLHLQGIKDLKKWLARGFN